jgi:hypothetical protein
MYNVDVCVGGIWLEVRAKQRSLAELGFYRVVGLCGTFSMTSHGSRSGSRGKPGSSWRCRPIEALDSGAMGGGSGASAADGV